MKKIASTIIALSLIASSLSAFEWGGKFENTTRFDKDLASDFDLKQKDALNLWITTPLNKTNTAILAAEGSYAVEYDQTEENLTNIIDLNLCKFSYTKTIGSTGTFLLNAGRFGICDSTNIIFSQKCDGVLVGYSIPFMTALAYGGFTGLINGLSTTIITPEYSKFEKSDGDFYIASANYMPFAAMLKFPAENQNLNLQAWGFADLNGDSFNRYYASMELNGSLEKNVSYRFNTTFGTEDFDNLTTLLLANMYFYPGSFTQISIGGTYASGKSEFFEPFVGFTSMTAYLSAVEPEYSDLLKFELNTAFSVKTIGTISAGGAAVFDSTVKYQGFQWQFGTDWNILSDIQIGLSAYQFYGVDTDDNETSISFKASINF